MTLVERVKQFFGFSPQESENEREKPLSSEVDKKEKEKDESVNFFNNVIQFLMKLKLFAVSFINFTISRNKLTNCSQLNLKYVSIKNVINNSIFIILYTVSTT